MICNGCQLDKDLDQYQKAKGYKDGVKKTCKACFAIYKRVWMSENPDKVKAQWARDRAKIPAEIRYQRTRKWVENNWGMYLQGKASLRARMRDATPTWLTKDDKLTIAKLYDEGRNTHHVDHIVPLNGKHVSGLHVPWNLQLLTPEDNMKKHNTYETGI